MRAILLGALLVLSNCKEKPAKPMSVMERIEAGNLSDDDLEKVTSQFPGMTKACIQRVRKGGINAFPERTEDCFEMTPQQRWTGLWRAALESSQFCADDPGKPAKECEYKEGEPRTWFEPNARYTPDGSLYRVEFIGRRTAHPGKFGAYGFDQHEMVVDRMISMRRVAEK